MIIEDNAEWSAHSVQLFCETDMPEYFERLSYYTKNYEPFHKKKMA